MKIFNWESDKNIWLKENRGVSFEDIVFYIDNGGLLMILNIQTQINIQGRE
jgi:uncharacterized DUF497 family protein